MKNFLALVSLSSAMLATAANTVFTPDVTGASAVSSNDSTAMMVSKVRAMRRPLTGYKPSTPLQPKAAPRAYDGSTPLLYGGVLYADTWTLANAPFGIYSSTTTAPIEVNQYYLGSLFTVQGGGFYNEGKYYFINYEIQTFDGEEYVYTTLYECTTSPFKQVAAYSLSMNNIARDLTFDPIEQKVYGIFSVGNLEASYLIGSMNLDAENNDFRVTELVTLDTKSNQVAIASDNRGTIYTIGVDGMLNRLDKANGALIPVGSTGVREIEIDYPQSATIDLATGIFYWAALKTDGSSALYTVDTTTGKATKIGDYPDNEEFCGIYVPYIPAAGAPLAVPELFPSFEDGSLTGLVAFDAPKESVGGSTLSGNLNYYMSVNGEELFSGEVRAGRRNEEVEMTLPENGWYTFSLTTENAAGRSLPKSLRTFVGKDAPVACANPIATNDERGADISLKWGKPRKGINGGYIDTLKISYDVIRMPGNIAIASGITDTICSDHIDNPDLHTYYYVITPRHENIAGIPSATNKVAVGYIAQVPYVENFDTDVDFDTYTVAHVGSTSLTPGNEWGTWNYTSYKGGVAQSSPIDGHAKDDWLFTPPVHLAPTCTYRLTYRAMSQGNSIVPSFIEHMEVMMGDAPAVDAMTTMLVEDCAILNVYGSFMDFEATIHVEQEGEYHIGFHATTPAADLMWMLNIDDVCIEQGAEVNGPARVSDLSVTALPKGQLGALIAFKAPARTIANEPLDKLDKIEIIRGDKVIKTFTDVSGGASVEYTDNDAVQGINEYTVVAYTGVDRGLTDKRSVFVGFDIPGEVGNVTLLDVDGVPTVSWTRPADSGPNGHYVDSEALTYKVERYFSARDRQVVAENTRDLSFADTELSRPDQSPVTYIVTAINHIGSSQEVYSNSIFVGSALSSLPLRESFPQCMSTSALAYLSRSEGAAWGVLDYDSSTGIAPYDNDGGMAVFGIETYDPIPAEGFSSILYTNRFDIKDCTNPAVSFCIYNLPGSANFISLMVNVDSQGWTEHACYPIDSATEGWNRLSASLAEYTDCRYIQIGFRGVAHDMSYVYLDNILFDDMLDHNLQIGTISVPGIMEIGKTVKVETTVTNRGIQDAQDYNVVFYRNGIAMARIPGTRIAPGMTTTVGYDFIVGIDFEQQNDLYAEIDYKADMKIADNATPLVSVFVDLPRMAYVNDLNGHSQTGSVKLEWSAPDNDSAQPEPVTEGFDSYSPFIIDGIGDWTVIDGDAQPTWGISSNVAGQILQYPHAGEAMAWQVFNPVNAGLSIDYKPEVDPSGMSIPDWRPRSGSQMLGSFSPRSGSANDWLISPRLTGSVQLIKFYARSILNIYPETFEVLVSDSQNPAIADFERVATYTVGMTWTTVATVLPEGTQYVAIRCVSYGQFALVLDDITYAPNGAMPLDARLLGYNVYVDGTRITPQPISATEYNVNTDNAYHRYGVTAVYDIGESRMSNIVTTGSAGIADVKADSRLSVRNITGGLQLTSDTAVNAIIYTPAGVSVWSGEVNGTVNISLTQGLYIITSTDQIRPIKAHVR